MHEDRGHSHSDRGHNHELSGTFGKSGDRYGDGDGTPKFLTFHRSQSTINAKADITTNTSNMGNPNTGYMIRIFSMRWFVCENKIDFQRLSAPMVAKQGPSTQKSFGSCECIRHKFSEKGFKRNKNRGNLYRSIPDNIPQPNV